MPKKSQINECSLIIVHVLRGFWDREREGLSVWMERLSSSSRLFDCIAPLARAFTTLRGLTFHPCARIDCFYLDPFYIT